MQQGDEAVGLWDRKTSRPGRSALRSPSSGSPLRRESAATSRLTSSASLRPRATRRPAPRRNPRSAPALSSGRPQGGVGQRRRAGQPEAHEHRQRLVGNPDVPLDPLQVAGDAVEPARERGLQAIGAVGRQMRRERGFDDERLRHAFARGIVGELAGEVRRQPEGMLRPHARLHPEIVGADRAGVWRVAAPKLRCMIRWRCTSSSGSSSSGSNSWTGFRGSATISSCSGSSGSRRMPAFAGSSTAPRTARSTASSQSASSGGGALAPAGGGVGEVRAGGGRMRPFISGSSK